MGRGGAEMAVAHPGFRTDSIAAADIPRQASLAEQLRFLLCYAIFAPSSHNTQPWRFAIIGDKVQVYADDHRWLKVADPDRRELYISVGCAIENLIIAMDHFGMGVDVHYLPSPVNPLLAAEITALPEAPLSRVRTPGMFTAIPLRRTNHQTYLPEAVPGEDLQTLRRESEEPGVHLLLTTDRETIRQVDNMVTRADALLFADRAFRDELAFWIGQGAFGTPWLMAKLEKLAVQFINVGAGVASADHDLLMSSPVLGVISSERNDHESHLRVGQVLERIYLAATALGLSLQPMSHIIEAVETRAELAAFLGPSAGHPQVPFRLGFAEPDPTATPRLPLSEVLV
jgi:nitroreductase